MAENGGRGEAGSNLTGDVRKTAHGSTRDAEERFHGISREVEDRLGDVRGYAEDAGDWLRALARERPIVALGLAVGVGFVMGRLFSRT